MFATPQHSSFDWARAIERNSSALKVIVAALFAMLGLDRNVTVAHLPDSVRRAVLRVLRPAESAVRRLVVIAARGLVVKPGAARSAPTQPMKKRGSRQPMFKLFDAVQTFESCYRQATPRPLPRIHVFSYDPRVVALWARQRIKSPPPDGTAKVQRLVRRLQAIKSALDDLPHQARRLARARVRWQKNPGLKFRSPLRPGPPPGHRRKKIHEIDEILAECHGLARDALRLDTS
jgi:hypothetical protein